MIGNTILDLEAVGVSAVQYVPPVSPGSTDYRVPSAGQNQKHVYGSRYPLQVMGQEILVETQLAGGINCGMWLWRSPPPKNLRRRDSGTDYARLDRAGNSRNPVAGTLPGCARHGDWPEIVLDVAHNPAGAWALRSALSERYDDRPLVFVFGAMRDKAISEMTEILFPLALRVIATRPENPGRPPRKKFRKRGAAREQRLKLLPGWGRLWSGLGWPPDRMRSWW